MFSIGLAEILNPKRNAPDSWAKGTWGPFLLVFKRMQGLSVPSEEVPNFDALPHLWGCKFDEPML